MFLLLDVFFVSCILQFLLTIISHVYNRCIFFDISCSKNQEFILDFYSLRRSVEPMVLVLLPSNMNKN